MTVDDAIVAVGTFLQPLMPVGVEIIRGMVNDTPPPRGQFVVLTEVGQPQYTTTRTKLNDESMDYLMPKYLNVQMDFYGLQAGEMASTAVTMLRSIYTEGRFPDGVAPLYCSDAMQAPLTTGEKEYLTRWLSTLSLQYNAKITVSQESFNESGETAVIPVDVVYDIYEEFMPINSSGLVASDNETFTVKAW